MPNIPQYISKANVTQQSGGIKRNVSQAVAEGPGMAMQETGQFMQELGEKIRKIGNANAESNAAIDRKRFELDDSAKRAKEPDIIKSLDGIDAEVRKSRQDIANKHFSDPFGKAEWLKKQELDDEVYIIHQKAQGAKRAASERKVLVLRDVEREVSNGINAGDEEGKSGAIKSIEEIVNNPANVDIYDAEDKKKIVDDAVEKIHRGIKDQASLQAKKTKEITLARKFAKDQREDDLIKKRVDESLTFEEVRNAMDGDNPIDAKLGQSLINSMKSPKTVAPKTDFGVYGEIMDDITSGKSALAIKSKLMEAHKNGQLSDRDFTSLLYGKQLGNDPIYTLAKSEETPAKENGLVSAWNSIKSSFGNAVDAGKVMTDVFTAIQTVGQENIAAAVKEGIKKRLFQIHDWMMNIPKEGMKIMDASGVIKHITPDGEVTEAETSK